MSGSKLLVLFILLVNISPAQSQHTPTVDDTLHAHFQRLRTTSDPQAKTTINDSIRMIFKRVLKKNNFFKHPFDTLKTVGKLISPDEQFRIINWNTVNEDGTYNYYAFLQYYNDDNDEIVLTELTDTSDSIQKPEQQTLYANNWYGALYYEIVPAKHKRRKHYLLLGWDGGDLFINRKVLDVMTLTSSGKPRFGKNVFKFGRERKKRVIFEFSYMATMRLFYDDNIDMVVFEHMRPLKPSMKKQKMAYGSDLTFDALEFEDGKWILKENIDVKNSKKLLNKRKNDISYTF